jgi:hypothetical protein
MAGQVCAMSGAVSVQIRLVIQFARLCAPAGAAQKACLKLTMALSTMVFAVCTCSRFVRSVVYLHVRGVRNPIDFEEISIMLNVRERTTHHHSQFEIRSV